MMKVTIFALATLALTCAFPQDQSQAPAESQQLVAESQPQPAEVQQQPAQSVAPVLLRNQARAQPRQYNNAQVQTSQVQPVQIVKQDADVEINGYNFDFETSDGTARQEQGEYRNDTEQQGLLVKGSYRYIAPDGQHIAVSFIADKNGYQPTEHRDNDPAAQAQS